MSSSRNDLSREEIALTAVSLIRESTDPAQHAMWRVNCTSAADALAQALQEHDVPADVVTAIVSFDEAETGYGNKPRWETGTTVFGKFIGHAVVHTPTVDFRGTAVDAEHSGAIIDPTISQFSEAPPGTTVLVVPGAPQVPATESASFGLITNMFPNPVEYLIMPEPDRSAWNRGRPDTDADQATNALEGSLGVPGLRAALAERLSNNPTRLRRAAQGRNELCECGSGRKYKHCHG